MQRVKEVVKMVTDQKMYCILNIYHDFDDSNLFFKGMQIIDKYANLSSQIVEEFKNFNEYLIF